MPASFCFRDSQGNAAQLTKIDEEICQDAGDKVHPTNFSVLYEIIVNTGFGVLMGNSGFKVTKEAMDAHLAKTRERVPTFNPPQKDLDILYKFLCGTYTFEAWR